MSGVNAAPTTAKDSLTQALNANIIPNQEYLLQVNIIKCIQILYRSIMN